jgi:Fur family transcriptional regulator, ferric uptake regulator
LGGRVVQHCTMTETRDLFASKNLRCTQQRMTVYQALAACKLHPTAEQLHALVRRNEAGISLATVYNTLDVLVRAGLCRRFSSGTGPCRFDADIDEHLHIELPDGRMLDVPEYLSEAVLDAIPDHLIKKIEDRMGVKIARVGVRLTAEQPSATP